MPERKGGPGDPGDPGTLSRSSRILPPTEADDRRFQTDRRRASQSWERLRTLPFGEQARLVESTPEMQNWALAELLCDESARATAIGRGQDALQQARLALRVSDLVREDASWRARLEGFAWAHLANALRATGDLPEAEQGFRQAETLWLDGALSHPGPLDNTRMLRLEALLRRAQGRLNDGMGLLDRARTIIHTPETPSLQVQRGAFLTEAGRLDDAVQELLRAASFLEASHAPRLRLDLAFNLAVSLGLAGRHAEAEARLAALRKLATSHGTEVDRIRLRWLAARTAAGRGQSGKALTALTGVRNALAKHGLPYDAVLATLETAALHAGQGDASEVKELARGLAPLAQAPSEAIPNGARATLKLFCRLAEKDGLTPESTRRFADDFRRTGGDPNLRPEPWPTLD
jgi:tetratricopeptide (TPR) repeat protein